MRRWRNWTARAPSKREVPGSSPGRRTVALGRVSAARAYLSCDTPAQRNTRPRRLDGPGRAPLKRVTPVQVRSGLPWHHCCPPSHGTGGSRPHHLLARIRSFQGREDGSEPSGVTAEWGSSVIPAGLIIQRSVVQIHPPLPIRCSSDRQSSRPLSGSALVRSQVPEPWGLSIIG